MTLGSRQNLNRNEATEIYMEGQLIQSVEQQKLLGVVFDRSLTWDKQIDVICLNISRRITLLKLLSKYVDMESMKQYYNSYILPTLDYGCLIWGRCSTSTTLRLLKLQKRAARIILNVDILTPSKWLFQELNWLTFPKRVQYHTCNMVYKALNGQTPEYISDCFKKVSETHNRNLRSVDNNLLHIQNSRKNFMKIHLLFHLPNCGIRFPFIFDQLSQ